MTDSKEPKYKHTTYSKGFAVKITPSDRAADVAHAIVTGFNHWLCGVSLDGVEIELSSLPDEAKIVGVK